MGCGYLRQAENLLIGYSTSERVADADLIVVGVLEDRYEHLMHETVDVVEDNTYKLRYVYFDVGEIKVIEVLKGDCEEEIVYFRLPSEDQSQPNETETEAELFSPHDIWEQGIWMLVYDCDREPPYRANRGSYLPMDRIAEVKSSLKRSD